MNTSRTSPRRAMARMVCLGCVLVGGVLGYVGLQVQRVRVSYGIEALRNSRTRLEEQNRKLQLDLASLSAFARVDSAARRLGLTPPAPDQIRLATFDSCVALLAGEVVKAVARVGSI